MKKNRNIFLIAAAALAFAVSPGADARADTAASEWARTDQTGVRLVAAAQATGSGETARLGLQFRLEPGWKIYWRSPGDAGFPPKPDWTGSRNLRSAEFRWPAPERFELFGLDTFGYGDEVVLPIEARLETPAAPLNLKLALDYLVCEKICIPYQATLALDLPAGSAGPSPHAHLIDRFVARIPGDGMGSGLAIERAVWRGGGTPTLEVAARALTGFQKPDLIVEADGPAANLGFGRPTVQLSEAGRVATLRIPIRGDAAAKTNLDLTGVAATLTLIDGERAVERVVTLESGLSMPEPVTIGFEAVLGIALLGGLILNLMPCVLPVLSIKLLNFVGQGGVARARIRRNFLASAAGIVASFLGLAAALIGLKLAGATVGWGIQFQQPVFLFLMAVVVMLFAANLWGWFDIWLPSAWASAAAGPARPPHEERALGAFFTGVLATLLATPCSAPFVGTAVGFALAQGTGEILAIFTAMGVGLALPYLTVAAFPVIAARLPRPGPWMVCLRVALGFALLATAIWLVWLLSAQVDIRPGIGVIVIIAAVLTKPWRWLTFNALSKWRNLTAREFAHRCVAGAVAVLGIVLLGYLPDPPKMSNVAEVAAQDRKWRPFDTQAIETLVRDGRVVFVDVTADWCITCQVNKAAVVSRGEVAARLSDGRVVPMRADWTKPNDEIARYLANFGRYGIPFNVVYGPAAPEGIPLPEILTREAVLNAFDKAHAPVTSDAGRAGRGGG
jgi:suppressor for copper-sensitivity B